MKIYNKDGTVLLSILVDDDSYRYVELMGKDELTLKFALPFFVDIPIGSYCHTDFTRDNRYELMMPSDVTVVNRRNFEYTIKFESSYGHLRKYKIHNMVDGRLQFDLTATPREHLEQLVSNLNERDPEYGWKVGVCIEDTEKLITYDHTSCNDALTTIAETFDTEFEIVGNTISLHSVDYNIDNPLPLAYGCGNGFKTGVNRTNFNDSLPVERLFIQGGDRNIDRSTYATYSDGKNGSKTLLLPPDGTSIKFDGTNYKQSTESGYSTFKGREYVVTNGRKAIIRKDKALSTKNEDSLDLTDIYPSRVGRVHSVRYLYHGTSYKFSELPSNVIDGNWNDTPLDGIFIDIYDADSNIPDFNECQIAGEKMTVVFQTGMLAGKEFDLFKFEKSAGGAVVGRLELTRQEIDGVLMPNNVFRIFGDEERGEGKGDTYAIFHCSLPKSYYDEAELEMLKKAVKYMYQHEDIMFTFRGELDGIYAKKNWGSIGSKIVVGGHVAFKDVDIIGTNESFDTRIESIKQYVNNPHSPTITLSNEPSRVSVSSILKKVEADRVHIDEVYSNSILYTKRTYKQALESLSMIEDAFADGFTQSINPATVRTMAMLVGDSSLQFKVYDTSFTHLIPLPISFEAGKLTVDACGIKHFTLGIDDRVITPTDTRQYKQWTMRKQTLVPEGDNVAFYLYAKVSKNSTTDTEFQLSTTPISLDGDNYYYLLVGILSSTDENDSRSFAPLYGYTEILPNRILTGMIRSADGTTYFDLDRGVIGGRINFGADSTGLDNMQEWQDMATNVNKAQSTADSASKNVDAAKDAAEAASNDAALAKESAHNAELKADVANNRMEAWTSDSVISPMEFQSISDEIAFVNGDLAEIEASAAKYGVSIGQYRLKNEAYVAKLKQCLPSGAPWGGTGVLDDNGNIESPIRLRESQQEFYTSRTEALALIASAAEKLAREAQEAAKEAELKAKDAINAAEKAQELANTTSRNLEQLKNIVDQMNDDGIFDVNEKGYIRTLWESIHGAANTNELLDNDAGTYWTIKKNLDKYLFPTASSIFTYNGIEYTYEQKLIVFQLLGVTALDEAYVALRNYLASMNLYLDINTSNFNRTEMSSLFTRYYDEERNVTDAILADFSNDFSSLRDVLKLTPNSDKTTVLGGLILSKIISVRDDVNINNVVAGMCNVEGIADKSTENNHGRLMFFAGADQTKADVVDKMLNSTFRVFKDGYMYAYGATLESLNVVDATLRNVTVEGSIRSMFADNVEDVRNQTKFDNFTVPAWSGGGATRPIYNVPSFAEMSGRTLFITNYNGGDVNEGDTMVTVGRGGFFFEGSTKLSQLTFENWVLLKGFGTSDTFYGYIVLAKG